MVEEALRQKNIEYQYQSGQIVVDCPYCGKPRHLYIDPTKYVFYCHKCGQQGKWRDLLKEIRPSILAPFSNEPTKVRHPTMEYIQECHKRLLGLSGTDAIEYLKTRKITLDAIHHFLLGYEKHEGKGWIVIPFLKAGDPVNVKYRSIPPAEKEFRRWKDGESILFHQDCLKGLKSDAQILVTEGEFDCISLFAAGIENVVATSIGAKGFKPEWIDLLESFDRINIVYDTDEAGKKGAKDLAKRLDLDRCYNVELPKVKDVNDFFISGGMKDKFLEIVDQSKPFDIDNIVTIGQAFFDLAHQLDSKQNEALRSQWQSVSKLTGDYVPGDLIVLSATPKTGKTTFALNEALNIAKQDKPVLFYCLEMSPRRLVEKIAQIHLKVTAEELRRSPDLLGRAYHELAGRPLYFGYNYKKCTLDVVVETIRRGYKRYGFELVVFDNLHFLARSITHQVQEVGLISKTFKGLAEDLQIPIVLIAQPRKVADDTVISINDLKDSSSIGADADLVIVLYRRKMKSNDGMATEAFSPEMLVRVDASRFTAGGETVLYFDGAKSIIREIEKTRVA